MNRENEIINVRIEDIIPNRFQPRLTFNEEELKDLSESIKIHGIIQPLVLRRIGDKYEIIAGERRYKASVIAGLSAVPAVIMALDDKQSAEVAVVENLQRKNLSAIEEAQSYKKILDMGYVTQEELAKRMGVTQPTIANKLRLLNLTKSVQDALLKNKISERHARSLLAITDENIQITMLNRIINERLTVRQTDEEISKLLGKNVVTEVKTTNEVSPINLVEQKVFGVDVEKIKNESEDIIKEHVPKDINMLLKKESEVNSEIDSSEDSNILNNISSPLAINPFQETETEIMDFEISTQKFENPISTNVPESPTSSLIEEFRQQQEPNNNIEALPNEVPEKSLSSAITLARDEVRKIENLGFVVDTEEFDFEDMYQIIIKIKKD